MRRFCDRIRKYLPTSALVMLLITLLSLVVYIISVISPVFAGFVNRSLGHAVRLFLSILTYVFPFSLFEMLLLLALPVTVALVVLAFRSTPSATRILRSVMLFASVIGIIFSSYVFTLGVGYRTVGLDDSLGLDADEPTEEELFTVAEELLRRVNSLADSLGLSGESESGLTDYELSLRLSESYARLSRELGFFESHPTRIKPIMLSGIMTDAGITGIYSFFTGESNLNTAYPDYCDPFTVAHEFAHQRGFSRENEANFMAYLACISSVDEYIQYSGYLNMYEYIAAALYGTSPELYKELASELCEAARADILAAREVTRRHSDSPLGNIADSANDAYLKLNGTEGVISYGLVVRLAVAYELS